MGPDSRAREHFIAAVSFVLAAQRQLPHTVATLFLKLTISESYNVNSMFLANLKCW